jgi:hypothetical protein
MSSVADKLRALMKAKEKKGAGNIRQCIYTKVGYMDQNAEGSVAFGREKKM